MFPVKDFNRCFYAFLDEMDDAFEKCDLNEDDAEIFEDLNAETEDTLALFDEIDPTDTDWIDGIEDVLDTLEGLCGDYCKLSQKLPEIAAKVQQMLGFIDMAKDNLRA